MPADQDVSEDIKLIAAFLQARGTEFVPGISVSSVEVMPENTHKSYAGTIDAIQVNLAKAKTLSAEDRQIFDQIVRDPSQKARMGAKDLASFNRSVYQKLYDTDKAQVISGTPQYTDLNSPDEYSITSMKLEFTSTNIEAGAATIRKIIAKEKAKAAFEGVKPAMISGKTIIIGNLRKELSSEQFAEFGREKFIDDVAQEYEEKLTHQEMINHLSNG